MSYPGIPRAPRPSERDCFPNEGRTYVWMESLLLAGLKMECVCHPSCPNIIESFG